MDTEKLINDRFNSLTTLINGHFMSQDDRLSSIEAQTRLTNGRVTELEKLYAKHPQDCPSSKKIQDIERSLETYNVFLKYPKIFLGGIALLVLLSIFAITDRSIFKLFDVKIKTEAVK